MTQRPAAFISHPAFMAAGFGQHHPLSHGRQAAVVQVAQALGWLPDAVIHRAPLPDVADLLAFHTPDYLAALQRVSAGRLATADDRARYNLGTMECPVFDGVWDRARASVGGAVLAADLALAGHVAFHPAGGTHHGRPDRASGFCYLNDPVFAIKRLLQRGVPSVAYVDLDAHHGDGVEAAFTADPRVGVFSIHEAGRWPGTGQIRSSAGSRITNIVTQPGLGDAGFAKVCTSELALWLHAFARDAVVITLGADGLAGDPLSTMGLSNRCLWKTVDDIVAAAQHSVVLGGGGYNPWTTVRLWTGQWGRLAGLQEPNPLPAAALAVLAGLESDLIDCEDMQPHWLTTLSDPA
jgi:acetoin utilization protein AcuC